MFYGEGGRTFGPTGWISCTYFGNMSEGLDAIAEQCRLIRREGHQDGRDRPQRLTIRRPARLGAGRPASRHQI